jgi:hypothetical protein
MLNMRYGLNARFRVLRAALYALSAFLAILLQPVPLLALFAIPAIVFLLALGKRSIWIAEGAISLILLSLLLPSWFGAVLVQ